MYRYRLLIFQMTMLLAILLVFSLSWSQQLPVGMTSVTSEPTIEPWIPSEPTTEVPSTVDPTMEIPSTVEPTTEVSVTSEPTTEAPTLILSCPHDSPLPESPIDSVVSIPCDRGQFGDKTYTCVHVNSHPEWTLTDQLAVLLDLPLEPLIFHLEFDLLGLFCRRIVVSVPSFVSSSPDILELMHSM